MLDYITHSTLNRAGCTEQWTSAATDSEDNYKVVTPEHGPNVYTPDSFSYTYNSHGFRSAEFDLPSQLPIVFLGCSFTEGTGLPIEDIWAFRILEKIRVKTGKVIPFWNLAVAGTGIDTAASILYTHIDKLKPRHIFFLRPPWFRRQLKVSEDSPIEWMPGYGSENNRIKTFEPMLTNKHFALHQTDRSLTIIDLLAERYSSTVHHMNWQLLEGLDKDLEPALMTCKRFRYMHGSWIHRADFARDSFHPGPKTHKAVADRLWENDLRNYF
jgi:hypothetical protein